MGRTSVNTAGVHPSASVAKARPACAPRALSPASTSMHAPAPAPTAAHCPEPSSTGAAPQPQVSRTQRAGTQRCSQHSHQGRAVRALLAAVHPPSTGLPQATRERARAHRPLTRCQAERASGLIGTQSAELVRAERTVLRIHIELGAASGHRPSGHRLRIPAAVWMRGAAPGGCVRGCRSRGRLLRPQPCVQCTRGPAQGAPAALAPGGAAGAPVAMRLTLRARSANCSVASVSAAAAACGATLATSAVRAPPPSARLSSAVSLLSRNGTCGRRCAARPPTCASTTCTRRPCAAAAWRPGRRHACEGGGAAPCR